MHACMCVCYSEHVCGCVSVCESSPPRDCVSSIEQREETYYLCSWFKRGVKCVIRVGSNWPATLAVKEKEKEEEEEEEERDGWGGGGDTVQSTTPL